MARGTGRQNAGSGKLAARVAELEAKVDGLTTHCDLLGVAVLSSARIMHFWTVLSDALETCEDEAVADTLLEWRDYVQSELQVELSSLIAFLLPFDGRHKKRARDVMEFGAKMKELQVKIERTTDVVLDLLDQLESRLDVDDQGDEGGGQAAPVH